MEEIPVSMTTDGQCYFLVHYASEFFLWYSSSNTSGSAVFCSFV
jgi:hypothetical protein